MTTEKEALWPFSSKLPKKFEVTQECLCNTFGLACTGTAKVSFEKTKEGWKVNGQLSPLGDAEAAILLKSCQQKKGTTKVVAILSVEEASDLAGALTNLFKEAGWKRESQTTETVQRNYYSAPDESALDFQMNSVTGEVYLGFEPVKGKPWSYFVDEQEGSYEVALSKVKNFLQSRKAAIRTAVRARRPKPESYLETTPEQFSRMSAKEFYGAVNVITDQLIQLKAILDEYETTFSRMRDARLMDLLEKYEDKVLEFEDVVFYLTSVAPSVNYRKIVDALVEANPRLKAMVEELKTAQQKAPPGKRLLKHQKSREPVEWKDIPHRTMGQSLAPTLETTRLKRLFQNHIRELDSLIGLLEEAISQQPVQLAASTRRSADNTSGERAIGWVLDQINPDGESTKHDSLILCGWCSQWAWLRNKDLPEWLPTSIKDSIKTGGPISVGRFLYAFSSTAVGWEIYRWAKEKSPKVVRFVKPERLIRKKEKRSELTRSVGSTKKYVVKVAGKKKSLSKNDLIQIAIKWLNTVDFGKPSNIGLETLERVSSLLKKIDIEPVDVDLAISEFTKDPEKAKKFIHGPSGRGSNKGAIRDLQAMMGKEE